MKNLTLGFWLVNPVFIDQAAKPNRRLTFSLYPC